MDPVVAYREASDEGHVHCKEERARERGSEEDLHENKENRMGMLDALRLECK